MASEIHDVADPDPGLVELARIVGASADEIGRRAAESIRDNVPAYRTGDPVLHNEVIGHCRAVLRTVLDCMADNRSPTIDDFAVTTDVALHRATQGIGVADFMRGFRIAQITYWQHLERAISAQAVPEHLITRTVEILLGVIESGSSAAANAYLEAEQYRLADQDRARRDLIEDLIAGNKPIIGPRRGALRTAGLTDDAPFEMVSVILHAATSEAADSDDENRIREIRTHVRDSLTRARGTAGAGLVVARHTEVVAMVRHTGDPITTILNDVRDQLQHKHIDVQIGIGTAHTGFGSAPEAYQEACIARRFLGADAGVMTLSSMSPLSYLTVIEDPIALRLVDPRVNTFVADELAGDGGLLHTLEAYAAGNLNATAAAERLHIHVNTMYYRLDRIAERTGADLRDFRAMAELMVAVRLVQRHLTR